MGLHVLMASDTNIPMGSAAGGGRGRPSPDFGETYFNTFRPPPDFGGFCRQFGILFEKNKKIGKFSQISS